MWDVDGSSYHYICSALNNDLEKGLWKKKDSQVKSPFKCLLVGDAAVITYFHGAEPFMSFYWHDQKKLGWANVAYVDGHLDYLQMKPDDSEHESYTFQRGEDWTVLYDD
jgi:prepilin-type processing-associated H-X9-DG protein